MSALSRTLPRCPIRYEGEAKEYHAPAPKPAPYHASVPKPAPYHAPAPKPAPYHAPAPAPKPAPYHAPAPTYHAAPKPAPSYRQPKYVAPKPVAYSPPEPAYKPAPAPAPKPVYTATPHPAPPAYKPEPVYTATPAPAPYRPRSVPFPLLHYPFYLHRNLFPYRCLLRFCLCRPTYAPLVASASTIAPEYYVSPDGNPPTYDASKSVKRRMQVNTDTFNVEESFA